MQAEYLISKHTLILFLSLPLSLTLSLSLTYNSYWNENNEVLVLAFFCPRSQHK